MEASGGSTPNSPRGLTPDPFVVLSSLVSVKGDPDKFSQKVTEYRISCENVPATWSNYKQVRAAK